MAGEFAGNVELSLDCDPAVEFIIQQCLFLQIPGEDTGVEMIASGGPDDGILLCFHTDAIECLPEKPESLTFLWCDEEIASVSTELAESTPIDDVHRLIDPLEILGHPSFPNTSPFCLTVEYDWIWLVPAVPLMLLGAVLSFAPLGLPKNLLPLTETAGVVLALLGVAFGFIAFRRPKRQVWLDRDRREILLVEARSPIGEAALLHATRYSPDGYAHVRLCEREYAPEIGSDSDQGPIVYFVSLEGPIAYASADGGVHSRSDALHLATFSAERRARRFAAEVGHHLGLRILIATDW